MNVVDSSGWLEYFAGGSQASKFAPAIESPQTLLVPVITLYEVFKRVHQLKGEGQAESRVAHMMQSKVIEVSSEIALDAAMLAIKIGLPMADSLILATAQAHSAELWTMDADFAGIDGVRFIPKR